MNIFLSLTVFFTANLVLEITNLGPTIIICITFYIFLFYYKVEIPNKRNLPSVSLNTKRDFFIDYFCGLYWHLKSSSKRLN